MKLNPNISDSGGIGDGSIHPLLELNSEDFYVYKMVLLISPLPIKCQLWLFEVYEILVT